MTRTFTLQDGKKITERRFFQELLEFVQLEMGGAYQRSRSFSLKGLRAVFDGDKQIGLTCEIHAI